MRKQLYYVLAWAMAFGLWGCPVPLEEFSQYQPVLMSRQQLETSVAVKPARPISVPGKVYRYGSFIFINEQYKGVHIINNTDPAAPQNVAFLQVPGSLDIAVKDNVLYVDNAVDLVAVDISNVTSAKEIKRIKNVFPPLKAPDNLETDLNMDGAMKDAIVVAWELKNR